MDNVTKIIVSVATLLIVAAILGIWKLISNKANRSELITPQRFESFAKELTHKTDLEKVITNFDADIRTVNVRVDEFNRSMSQYVTKADLLKDLGAVTTRADDKELRIQRDMAELKTDLKSAIEKLTAVDKKLDELPTRVSSLETTRNETKK